MTQSIDYKLKDSRGRPLRADGVNGSIKSVTVNARCPHCLRLGIFAGINQCPDASVVTSVRQGSGYGDFNHNFVGVRYCPNVECQGLVFVIGDKSQQHLMPPERIDFDATSIPDTLKLTLEEAVGCHAAQCYRAAALMVRRLLEELCDFQGTQGHNLFARITALKSKIVISEALIEGAHHLRLLGNDAAHISAKTYDTIGKDEVEIGIEVAKRILEAVYQHSDLVDRLKKLAAKAGETP